MKNETVNNCLIVMLVALIVLGICFIIKGNKESENIGGAENIIEINENIKENNIIFSNNYEKAENMLKDMTIDEKIGQLFLVRYPEKSQVEILEKYKVGGYIFFEKDFKNKKEEDVKAEISNLQNHANIPLLIAVDEEGGKVVRVSSNKSLRSEKFKSPSELYKLGGFDKVKQDTIDKSNFLYNLGINLNLAPVVDVPENKNDYIYQRTLGENTELTNIYAKTVIEASKEGKVSYTLKHFPGYGSNSDTHTGIAVENKSYDEIMRNDLPPFKMRNRCRSRSSFSKP